MRGPDIRVVHLNNPESGKLIMSDELGIGAGNHGGLLPQEIHCLLAMSGNAFAEPRVHDQPAGHDDFAVTVMSMMGLLDPEKALQPLPSARPLNEALGEETTEEKPVTERLRLQCDDYAQYIERVHYRGETYVTCGARETEFEDFLK